MSAEIRCYRCGASLAMLSLPLSRRDACPSCNAYLHVCRMCEFFDATVARQCREDDAEEVTEKDRMNFCEWFKPRTDAFDPVRAEKEARAKEDLAALFGAADAQQPSEDEQIRKAKDLFR